MPCGEERRDPKIVRGGALGKHVGEKGALKGEVHPGLAGVWAANPAGLLLARNDFLCYRPSPTAYKQRCVLCNERKAGVEMLLA